MGQIGGGTFRPSSCNGADDDNDGDNDNRNNGKVKNENGPEDIRLSLEMIESFVLGKFMWRSWRFVAQCVCLEY